MYLDSVRERAKAIVELLENEEMLEDERVRAKQIRERMSHMTSAYSSEAGHKAGNSHKYESYNNKTFQERDNQDYYDYGAGNYGDRKEDHSHPTDYFHNMNRYETNTSSPASVPPTQPKKEEK